VTAETTLEQATRHVRDGRRIIAEQRALIVKQKEGGHDTEAARSLLVQFEAALVILEDDLRAIQDAAITPN
jgi:hypothetical protein